MERLGDYKILAHIGHGAMGSVEKGEAPDGTIVAIKTLFPQFAYEAEYVKRFKREAEIAKKLSHPNVVKIIDVGEDQSTSVPRPYIVMEYVDGKSLADMMHDRGMASASVKRSSAVNKKSEVDAHAESASPDSPQCKTFTPEETIRIMRQLAGVLQAAEDIGLLHRDVKPQNIMLDSKGNAKLLDFGLAKDTDALVSVLSMTGQSIGTPPYMSPEQHEGKKDIDIRSDLYALGCTAYHMLTGRPPFEGPTNSAFALQHREKIPEPVLKLNKNCPLNLSQLIERLLAKKPEDRHQTPAELIEDLNRVERGEVPLRLYKPKKSKKHNPYAVWITAAVVALAALGAFFGWNYYRSNNAKTIIAEVMTDSRQLAVKHEFDLAKEKLDNIIAEYAATNPKLVKDAETLREKLIEQHAKWVSGEAERKRNAEAAKLARAEAERKRQIAENENNRRRNLHNNLRNAARLCRNEDACKRAANLINQAYQLCNTDAERAQVAAVEKQVKTALAKVRPWAAVADFTLDGSVKVDLTGSAVAVKLEQALGRKYRLVTRSQVSKALKELRFQASDLADKSNAKKFGKIVGAEYLVTGSVVQLGKEITVACQCFSIETGAIKQTAEVSAFSVDDFNYMIREAANILGMDDDQKRQYTDEKFNYPKHLEAGKKAFNNGEYEDAVRYFKRALSAKRTNEAESLLKAAAAKAEEQRVLNERKAKYALAMTRGNKLLREHRWSEAQAAFKEAQKISGYEYDSKALEGVKTAQGGAEVLRKKQLEDKFNSLIASGNSALRKQDWTGAEAAFNAALKVEGHEYAESALEGIRNAKGGAELMRKRNVANAAFSEAMTAAKEALIKATQSGYKNYTFKALCDAGTSKLEGLKNSAHWRYVSKSSQRAANSLSGKISKLKTDYADKFQVHRAMLESEKVYSLAAQLYRESRLLNKKDPKAHEKCAATVKAIGDFMASSHYRYVTSGTKRRLSGLNKQATAYLKTLVPPLPNDLKMVPNAVYASLAGLAPGSREAQERQKKWVAKLGLSLEVETKKIGIKLRLIPPGTFMMGIPASKGKREVQHQVTLTKPFYCGKFEVTQEQWKRVMGDNPSHFKNAGTDAPVERVSWDDCQKFLNKLCDLEGVLRGTYRLLTEAQWEYACRAGTTTPFCYGSSLDSSQANFDGNYPCNASKGTYRQKTTSVGSFSSNAWGLYDMHGNVWEWCSDWYGSLSSNSVTDPAGASSGPYRVNRGGSWDYDAGSCRSADRGGGRSSNRADYLGFRLMRIVPKKSER
jgi:formylglycine-generating enzyme required for sulfatase activity/serine/threonine protein kinase